MKTMKNSVFLFTALAAVALSFVSCDKKEDGNGPAAAKYTIYAGGCYYTGNKYIPCVWIDGKRTDLALPAGTERCWWQTKSFDFTGGKVYTVQPYWNREWPSNGPYYYADGIWKTISLPAGADDYDRLSLTFNDIAVLDGAVYITGYYAYYDDEDYRIDIPRLWKDGEIVELESPRGADNFGISYVAVSDGKVYVAGSKDGTFCYWVDGMCMDFLDHVALRGHGCSAFAVSGSRIYLAGDSYKYADAWQYANGTLTYLPSVVEERYGRQASSIMVSDGKVYVAGRFYEEGIDKPCYWVDGEPVALSIPEDADMYSSIFCSSVAVAGGTVYAVGGYNIGYDKTACLWIDGERQKLQVPLGNKESYCYEIQAVKK